MDVPWNTNQVAWYQHGPRPGESGSAVLAAHVDLSDQGRGVFYDLRRLRPGDLIVIVGDDDEEMHFVVTARNTYHKDDLPLETIFSPRGAPTLTLVTCGGGFNRAAQTYDSNVVVYATPLVDNGEEPPSHTPTPERT